MAKTRPPKRHLVTIKRPSSTLVTKGQKSAATSIVIRDVPCSIETLSGKELELARQTVADATHRVIMWADPDHPITQRDYAVVTTDGRGERTLRIGHYDDIEQKGQEWVLLCTEER